jgi:hypothetical protein
MKNNKGFQKWITTLLLLLFPTFQGMAANYLCFTAEQAGSTVRYQNRNDNNPDMKFSLDGEQWTDWAPNERITLGNVGDYVYVKGNNPDGFSYDNSYGDAGGKGYTFFSMTGSIAASGSVMSLVDETGESSVIPSPYCFSDLFYGCTALTSAPKLPATELKHSCYALMFHGCKNLTQAPELPATTLTARCYASMFFLCEKLEKAPALPALTLAQACYASMFFKCTSLKTAPSLPVVALVDKCYYNMFAGCESLENAPELPATELVSSCYSQMFNDCINLKYVKVGVISLANSVNATTDWVEGIDGEGVFIFPCGSRYNKHGVSEVPTNFTIISSPIVVFQNPDSTEIYRDTIGCDVMPVYRGETPTYKDGLVFRGWDKEPQIRPEPDVYYYTATYDTAPSKTNYLCFTAEEANSTVALYKTGCFVDVLYSFDGEEPWTTWESGDVVTLRNVGDKVYVKGDNPYSFSMSENIYAGFRMTGRIAASGSVMSLIDGVGTSRTLPNAFCFERLFYGCAALVQAPELPATELTAYCYDNMFDNCGITEMPELPASNLSEGCYAGMFRNCEKLTETTSLAAQVMQPECYMQMFKGCSSLAYAPSLISKEMAESCYERMFEGCTSLISPPVLPAIKLAKSCYSHMFNGCTSLTNPTSMPGVPMADFCCSFMYSGCTNLTSTGFLGSHELAPHCYSGMFQGCSKLTRVDKLPATDLAEGCYSSMFSQCTSLTEAPELPAMNLAKSCYESMFTFCQGLTKAPELPATTLAPSCYSSMFNSCRNLTEASELPAMTLASSCYERMYANCLSLQKAPELPAAELVESCYNGMFLNCSLLNYIKVGVMSLLNDFSATENWVKKVDDEGIFVFPCGSTYDEHGPSEVPTNFTIRRYKIAIYQNPDSTELWRDSIGCEETPVYGGSPNPPTYGEGKIFKEWKRVFTSDSDPDILYYVAEYEDDVIDAVNWLYFIAKEAGTTVSYINVGGNSPDVQYALDFGGPWSPLAEGQEVILENVGDRIFLKGNNLGGFSHAEDVYTQFKIEGLADLSGSVMSLIDGKGISKVIPNDYCFTHLFENCKINRFMEWCPLPALSLKAYCYSYMFAGCESLLNPVASLPATELAPYCYSHMFEGCTNIPTTIALSAEELAEGCYAYMFNRCSMLSLPYELPAIKLAPYCYSHMFSGCESMYEIPALPASKMEPYCYESMFSGCKAMKKMPMLLSRSLAEGCYSNMFRSCDILSEVFSLPAENLSDMCYYHMFDSCVSLTELPPLPAKETKPSCYEGMFRGCKGIAKAPELPAGKLSRQCYRNMFEGCSSLNYIKVGVLSLDNDFEATDNWVKGVDGPGVFIFPCGSTYDKHGDSEVPDLFDIYSSPIIIFQNPDSTVLGRDTIGCEEVPEYKGATPTFRDGLVFSQWDKPLVPLRESGIFYFTAEYGSEENPDLVNALSFTAVEPNSSVWYRNSDDNQPDIQYSLDFGKTWVQWKVGDTVNLSRVGDRVYVRGNNPQGFSHGEKFVQKNTFFCMSGGISAAGSVMSLIDGVGETTVIPCDSCFYGLFSSCVALRNAPRLPATTLAGSCYMTMFSGCTNLQEAPELPATEMADFCYSHMFYDTRITTPPALPARKLAYGCYSGMFFRCLELTRMPELPATELAPTCYSSMFGFCEKLTQVTELPAMKMEEGCYTSMFSDCVRLGTAPELPATELAPNCYAYMFSHCNSLINAPKLPAEELAEGCYTGMFMMSKCLAEAPELLATELKTECYKEMFGGCDALNYIKVGVKSLDNEVSATADWVWGVNRKGTFIFPCGSTYDKRGSSEVPTNFEIIASPIAVFQNPDGTELQRDTIDCETVPEYRGDTPTYGDGLVFKGWDPVPTLLPFPDTYYFTAMYEEEGDPDPGNWLVFRAEEANTIVSYNNVGGNAPNVQYSIDGGRTWFIWENRQNIILENAGDTVYVGGYNPEGFSSSSEMYTVFSSNKKIAASGSVMSLIDQDGSSTEIPNAYCFHQLFSHCPLTQAPELPATSLKDYCYSFMFSHCEHLAKAPELPATEMAKACYYFMFANCVSLNEVPSILPATQLADSCYAWMFESCRSLEKAPSLPATTMASFCYFSMFGDCASLSEAPELPATQLAENCYTLMLTDCKSLSQAPKLPATQLERYCYSGMFYGCTNMEEAPELPATELVEGCYNGMFAECTALVKAPELLAPKLVQECYRGMFENCSNLNYIQVGVMTLDNDVIATLDWVVGVDGPGTFVFPCGSKYDKHGVSEVPTNFTIISSPIVVFRNADSTELQRDTIDCQTVPEYRGEEPTIGEGYTFKGWDNDLTILPIPATYYYTAVYEKKEGPAPDNWLCFTAEEAGSQVWYTNEHGDSPDVHYSIDGGETWSPLYRGDRITLENVGDKVYLKGDNAGGFSHVGMHNSFSMTGKIAASGSVMSLIDGKGVTTVIPNDSCFIGLFTGCQALTQAPELTATTLTNGCYLNMFSACESLTKAPELPATELADHCYEYMFTHCKGLESAPELPATEMKDFCYKGMFQGCWSLVTAPKLPSKSLAFSCYAYMFGNCFGLENAPELPATTLAPGCYAFMFSECSSLAQAPELPASTLVESCYQKMFKGCKQLNYIKVGVMSLDNDLLATMDWVDGVDGPGTFIFPCGSKYDKHGVSEVPTNFTIVSSPIVVFLNPGGLELWRDTVDCKTIPEYRGEEPFIGDDYIFVGWDNDLTVLPIPDTYYYTAVYEEKSAANNRTDLAISACDSFAFEGIIYTENASWNDTLTSATGADSILAYHLTVHKSVVTEENLTAEGSYTWKDITFTEDASWNDTLRTAFGCDSVVRYHLEIKEVITDSATVTDIPLIACDSLVFEGVTYRESASWNDTLPAANGGDSILAYHLTIHKSVVREEYISAEGSYTWKDITFTEDASWNDTLQTAFGCDSIIFYNLKIEEVTIPNPAIVTDIPLTACDSFVFEGVTYRESREWNDTLPAANGGDSILAYHLTIHKSVVKEKPITAVDSYTWQGTTYTEDASWNDTLQTVFGCDSIVRYHLTIEKETPDLQLTVEDELYLVLPGGTEKISYELTGGEGAKYEVRQDGKVISSGDVTNDSAVSLTCPSSLEPGAYEATLEMCDNEGNCAEKDFTFNVMRPDDKQKSFYVKVWNDVVICRNGGGVFQTFQWYKNGKKCEKDTLQYLNDVALLDGEYMVFVTETSGKSYFIEPIHYDAVEAAYTITAEPNVVAKGTEFTLKVSGVEPDQLANARIVAYHANGVVEKILDEVEEQQTMRLKPGEYVVILTVNDGKNANCKVLVK